LASAQLARALRTLSVPAQILLDEDLDRFMGTAQPL
jgi:hypothetical protein